MKKGYDSRGVCCGPVAGSTILEIEMLNENNEKFYVHNSGCESYTCEYIVISKELGFEDAINRNWNEMFHIRKAQPTTFNNTNLEIKVKRQKITLCKSNETHTDGNGSILYRVEAEEWFEDYKEKDTSEVHILGFIDWGGHIRAY